MFKLDPITKAKWLEALRSGVYTQTVYSLRNTSGGYCCMGVLCDIKNPSGWTGEDPDYPNCISFVGGHDVYPPEEFLPREVAMRLAAMNDGANYITAEESTSYEQRTFPQIADWIEENL
jgi:hypothetical protein